MKDELKLDFLDQASKSIQEAKLQLTKGNVESYTKNTMTAFSAVRILLEDVLERDTKETVVYGESMLKDILPPKLLTEIPNLDLPL